MAVAGAVLDAVLEPGFLERVQAAALRLKQQLGYIQDAYPHIVEEVRGNGLLLGLKVKPPQGEVIAACLDEKLLTVAAGDNVIRLLPPLNITDEEIGAAVSRLSSALARLSKPV
jgi:acetylornithine/N-succinyldiaminopimelate aminotransferase